MSKLMQNEVLAIERIQRAGFGSIPRENHRSHSAARLALPMHRSFLPHRAFNVAFLFYEICLWNDKNREYAREIVGLAIHHKNAILRCDCDHHFISGVLPAPTFES